MKQKLLFVFLVIFLTACNVEKTPRALLIATPTAITLLTPMSAPTVTPTHIPVIPTKTPTATDIPRPSPTPIPPTTTPEPTETIEVRYPYDCSYIVDISLVDDLNGWAVVDCFAFVGNRAPHKGLVYRLINGHWQVMTEAPVLGPSYSCYKAVSAVSAEEMWAVGLTGGIYNCQDGNWLLHYKDGEWERVDIDSLFASAGLVPGLVDIEMLDTNNGWAIGHGTILRYQQGEWSIELKIPLDEDSSRKITFNPVILLYHLYANRPFRESLTQYRAL